MPIEVEAPDGSIIEFPDGMSDGQIAAVMRQQYPPQRPRAPRGRRMAQDAADAQRRGYGPGSSVGKPIKLSKSLKIGSPQYKAELAKLPVGAYYLDPQGNVRQYKSQGGNRIIQTASQRSGMREPGGAASAVNRGTVVLPYASAALGTLYDAVTGDIKPEYRKGEAPIGMLPLLRGAGNSFQNNLAAVRGTEDDFAQRRPIAAAGLRTAGVAPTLFIPGGVGAQATTRSGQVANIAGNAALQGGIAGALDRGTLKERGQNTVVNALAGWTLGSIGGAIASKPRVAPQVIPASSSPLNMLQARAPQSPAALRQAAGEYRAVGIQPTLADVTDDSGRAVVRATASRMTPARDAVGEFQQARALNLPDRISGQARRYVSSDPRTPDAIRAEIAARRSATADQAFGAVRDAEVSLDPDTIMALRSPQGRAAIKSAANASLNSLDPADRAIGARLNRLADEAIDAPGDATITVGMAQQISKSLSDAAERARGPVGAATNETRLFTQLSQAVRGNARNAVPGYDEALRGYEADSGLMEAVDVGRNLTRANTDDFVSAVEQMTPDQRLVARAGARRAIEGAVGENTASAPGFARKYSRASEPMARTNALLGPVDAPRFQNALALEERAVQNANFIAPKTGSQTQLRDADSEAVSEGMGVARRVVSRDWMGLAFDVGERWWRSRGFDNAAAEEFTRLAIDPNRLDEAISYIEQRFGPEVVEQFKAFTAEDAIKLARTAGAGATAANQNYPASEATANR